MQIGEEIWDGKRVIKFLQLEDDIGLINQILQGLPAYDIYLRHKVKVLGTVLYFEVMSQGSGAGVIHPGIGCDEEGEPLRIPVPNVKPPTPSMIRIRIEDVRFYRKDVEDYALHRGSFVTPDKSSEEPNHFILRGQYWDMRFQKEEGHIKDRLGIKYLVQLLNNPYRDVHVFQLMEIVNTPVHDAWKSEEYTNVSDEDLGHIGMMRSGPTRGGSRPVSGELMQKYRSLQGNLAKAARSGDPLEIEEAQRELDEFEDLITLVMKPERDKQLENARTNVQQSIKRAYKALKRSGLPKLCDHLNNSVKKGYKCSYKPDPELVWKIKY
jgi:hypothetical protein